jgi:DNA modification methylase
MERFGIAQNPLRSIREMFDVNSIIKTNKYQWPMTIWELDHSSDNLKKFKKFIGDDGTAREHSGTAGYKTTLGSSPNQVSIYNPIILGVIYAFYKPKPNSVIYDPFGGGGTRALMTTSMEEKLHYIGVEIRKEEVDAVEARLTAAMDVEYIPGTWQIIHGDSRHVPSVPDDHADMLITCPPYYDMEQYDGGEADLSMAPTYSEFYTMLSDVIAESKRILKPGALSFWTIGLHRNKEGHLLPMHHDLATAHHDLGFELVEEVILHMKNTGSVQRVGNFAKGKNRLVRVHEYLLIFRKRED